MEAIQQDTINSMLLWTIAATVSMLLLVLAGITLSARSFTQLLALIRYLGSLVEVQLKANLPVQTSSSQETESDTPSSLPEDTPITPENRQSS